MGNISSKAELHYAIQLLEAEQAVKLDLMKKQFQNWFQQVRKFGTL